MKKLKLSGFDLGVIIAFVVITLLGGGAWWYLSGALQDSLTDVTAAKADFDKYASNPNYHYVVSRNNAKTLQDNIDLIKAQLVPLINTTFESKDNKLRSITREDPVAWKRDLDDNVHRLNASAKVHNVTVPPNFYFGFTRYLSQSPNDEQTLVLSKQLSGVEQLAAILINGQVRGISAIRRTYEEDRRANSGVASGPAIPTGGDHLSGYSMIAAGKAYTAYPFEIEFETTAENFRTVIDNLIQSPYLFVVRSVAIKNSSPASPTIGDLQGMAGPPPAPPDASADATTTAAPVSKGPQYLFGHSTLMVKARIDMIEWTADVPSTLPGAAAGGGSIKPPRSTGGT